MQRRQGQWPQSLTNAQRAVELDPANLSYLRNLIGTLMAGNHYVEARAMRQRLVALQPGRIQEAYLLATVSFFATGETREGGEFFARLTAEQRDSPLGLSLGQGWARIRGDLAEAIRLDQLQPYYDGAGTPRWQQAISAAVDRSFQGDRSGAINRLGAVPAELRQQLEREPHNSRNWVYLAVIETILGNREEAQRYLGRSAKLLPESRDALDGVNIATSRAFCYGFLGDKDMAISEFRRLLRTPYGPNVHSLRATHFPFADDPDFQALLADPKNNAPLF